MNEAGNDVRSITVGLPEDVLRDLIALRVKHGANSPIGHRCSMAVEQGRSGYLAGLQKTVAELARLTFQ